MMTPDEDGKIWHRGTKIGFIYSLIALAIVGLTTTQDPAGSLAWLERFAFLVILSPLAAASQAYVAGKKDASKSHGGSPE